MRLHGRDEVVNLVHKSKRRMWWQVGIIYLHTYRWFGQIYNLLTMTTMRKARAKRRTSPSPASPVRKPFTSSRRFWCLNVNIRTIDYIKHTIITQLSCLWPTVLAINIALSRFLINFGFRPCFYTNRLLGVLVCKFIKFITFLMELSISLFQPAGRYRDRYNLRVRMSTG